VLGLPRGGVPVAAEIAKALDAPLDLILVRKLGVPFQPELAMGAIGEDGVKVENQDVIRHAQISPEQIESVERTEREELERRAHVLRDGRPRVPIQGNIAVVVDDGIATGSTALAACLVARAEGASRVVMAAPVAPLGWEERFEGTVDETVSVVSPRTFSAIGQFYDDFRQLTDEEVIRSLADWSPALTYKRYLALDQILSAQHVRSGDHDEMLFIVVHQVYELWFKPMIHELRHLQRELEAGNGAHSLHTLRRMLTILKVAVAQIDVLETMTPREFTGFRGRLEASSGFQSAQFRELEALLGRRDDRILDVYKDDVDATARISEALKAPALFDSFLHYLAHAGYSIPTEALERNVSDAWSPSKGVQEVLLQVYGDDGEAAQVAERMVDFDEGLQEWRYRHVKMVERTIGDKPGTGGSAGAAYLRSTLFKPVFPDLWAVRSSL
ncbi:MAG TPA: tryptophan 2,3-dioxygenase family protein, partial [Acidimicrobiales bacterium]|nr:tryptophan 2,3-dioxygenase family protein [Acidimicrobiales bacterium]